MVLTDLLLSCSKLAWILISLAEESTEALKRSEKELSLPQH